MMSLMLVVKFCFGTGQKMTTCIEQITILAHEDLIKVLFVNSLYGEIQFLNPVFIYFPPWLNFIIIVVEFQKVLHFQEILHHDTCSPTVQFEDAI